MKTFLGITGIFLALGAVHHGNLGVALLLVIGVFVIAIVDLQTATGHSPLRWPLTDERPGIWVGRGHLTRETALAARRFLRQCPGRRRSRAGGRARGAHCGHTAMI